MKYKEWKKEFDKHFDRLINSYKTPEEKKAFIEGGEFANDWIEKWRIEGEE